MNENSKNRSEKHLKIREFICFMKGKESLAYSKPCSKVVHLQQTIHFGYKTFGWTYAQTEIERNILK